MNKNILTKHDFYFVDIFDLLIINILSSNMAERFWPSGGFWRWSTSRLIAKVWFHVDTSADVAFGGHVTGWLASGNGALWLDRVGDWIQVITENNRTTLLIGKITLANKSKRSSHKSHLYFVRKVFYFVESWKSATDALVLYLHSSQKGVVLVHCNAGVSRAPAVVVGFLMSCEYHTFDAALALVQSARPAAAPNPGFIEQLKRSENPSMNGSKHWEQKERDQRRTKEGRSGWRCASLNWFVNVFVCLLWLRKPDS